MLKSWAGTIGLFAFLGECLLAMGNLLRGRARFRWSDAFLIVQQCGPQALGIVAMINFLVGLILAFVGATELMRFGASIYVADLVGVATVREMGCLMTGIILCGRTGAAFAAQLGTMRVNEEISALETFGVPPIEFLSSRSQAGGCGSPRRTRWMAAPAPSTTLASAGTGDHPASAKAWTSAAISLVQLCHRSASAVERGATASRIVAASCGTQPVGPPPGGRSRGTGTSGDRGCGGSA